MIIVYFKPIKALYKYPKSPFSDPSGENFRLYDDIFILMIEIKAFRDIKDTIAVYPWVRLRGFTVHITVYLID